MVQKVLPELVLTKDGNIHFPNIGVYLSTKELTPEDCDRLLQTYHNPKPWACGESGRFCYAVTFEGEKAVIGFNFSGARLIFLLIGMRLSSVKLLDGWPTEADSKKEIQFVQKAFHKQFGGKLKYGKPFHYFDLKNYCAQCGISYEKI